MDQNISCHNCWNCLCCLWKYGWKLLTPSKYNGVCISISRETYKGRLNVNR